ncbi:MAG: rod shape-determining protein MreD [Zoogloeaceae bacterium]|jgi:rod shape-determining protein MreD|nr:rod shape-determining protein MreD [Zoogloeaceae bacterium]
MYATNQSARILKPAQSWFILLSLLLALLLNMLPTRQWLLMPDWVMLTLAFWSVRECRKVGLGTAFLLGVLMDMADGAALGQHALAYVLLCYAATSLSRRLLWFPLTQQALHIAPLFFVAAGLQILIRMVAGGNFPGWGQFLAPFIATLLWPTLSFLLLAPQYQPEERDENRPI